MKTHTNGPWTIGDDCCVYGNHGMIRPFVAQIADDYNDGETQANARLIAAAPDMLAALEMVDRIWRHDQTANISPNSPLAIVRAAIAKATGETP